MLALVTVNLSTKCDFWCDLMFSRLGTIPAFDGLTDRQTHDDRARVPR